MGTTLSRTLSDEGRETVLTAFRSISDADMEALRFDTVARQLAEAVLGERSHHSALLDELEQAKRDVLTHSAHVESYKAALKKAPTGTARVELEDLLKQYQTRLDGAKGNVAAVEAELAAGGGILA
jgi:hypothetical protein